MKNHEACRSRYKFSLTGTAVDAPGEAPNRGCGYWAPPRLQSCQRDHAAPELLTLGGVDIILAHECEPAIVGDAIDHNPGSQCLGRVPVAHSKRPDARSHQQAPAGVDAEGAQVDAVALGGLDQIRLTGMRIDREHRNVVLAAVEDLFAFKVDLALVAVGEIDEPPV